MEQCACLFITRFLTFAKFPSLPCSCGICWIPPSGRWVNKATPDSGDFTWKVNSSDSGYFRTDSGDYYTWKAWRRLRLEWLYRVIPKMGGGGVIRRWLGSSDTAAVAFLADCKMIVHVKLLTQFQYSISVECCCMDSKIFLTAWSEINGLCHIHQGATARELLQPGWCYILCYGHIFLLIGKPLN